MSKRIPRRPVPKIPIRKKKPLTVRTDPCFKEKQKITKAAAIVGQVLVHFGAGYGLPPNPQIFATPADLAVFFDLLMASVLKNVPSKLDWEIDQPGRDAVCQAAFKHGALARATAGAAPLMFSVILATLREIQASMCPSGAGGGPVCEF